MNKLFCMFGLHWYNKWVAIKTVKIVSGKNDEYTSGYHYYYSKTCPHCNKVKHRLVRV